MFTDKDRQIAIDNRIRKTTEAIESGNWFGSNLITLRKYLLKKRGASCEVCKLALWNGRPIHLETHHIDGDHKNNKLENVMLICPNCHSQTETYKCYNRGNGRKYRNKQ